MVATEAFEAMGPVLPGFADVAVVCVGEAKKGDEVVTAVPSGPLMPLPDKGVLPAFCRGGEEMVEEIGAGRSPSVDDDDDEEEEDEEKEDAEKDDDDASGGGRLGVGGCRAPSRGEGKSKREEGFVGEGSFANKSLRLPTLLALVLLFQSTVAPACGEAKKAAEDPSTTETLRERMWLDPGEISVPTPGPSTAPALQLGTRLPIAGEACVDEFPPPPPPPVVLPLAFLGVTTDTTS